MVVTTRCDLAEAPVLSIGKENVQRYFSERIPAIELHLGSLHIHCKLGPSFWSNRPEIRDARLRDWLKFSIYHKRPARKPVLLELIPLGGNRFSLQALSAAQVASATAGQSVATQVALPAALPVAPPIQG